MLNIPYLRELCKKATPPPWIIGRTDLESGQTSCSVGVFDFLGGKSRFNAAFTVAARTALPELLDRVEALEKVLVAAKRLREVQRMHRVPRQANEGEALLELDNALRDAGLEVEGMNTYCNDCGCCTGGCMRKSDVQGEGEDHNRCHECEKKLQARMRELMERVLALEWLLEVKEVTWADMDAMSMEGFREFQEIRRKAMRDAGKEE